MLDWTLLIALVLFIAYTIAKVMALPMFGYIITWVVCGFFPFVSVFIFATIVSGATRRLS